MRTKSDYFFIKILGIKESDIPRWRGCYVHKGMIIIQTRTGGCNRYDYECKEAYLYNNRFEDDLDYSGPWNQSLRDNKYFIWSQDAGDPTYADWYYRCPEKYKKKIDAHEKKMKMGD